MPLIPCAGCHEPIHNEATVCPRCGKPHTPETHIRCWKCGAEVKIGEYNCGQRWCHSQTEGECKVCGREVVFGSPCPVCGFQNRSSITDYVP